MFKNTPFVLCLTALLVGAFVAPAHAQTPSPRDWKIGIAITRNPEGDRTGVKIVRVFDDSPAKVEQLQKGDVIHAIDGKLFDDPLKVRAYVMDPDRSELTIVYQRGEKFFEQPFVFAVVTAKSGFGSSPRRALKPKGGRKEVASPRKPKAGSDPAPKAKKEVDDPRKK
jgi:C-terminal processing protease CtpA/Prc